MGLPGTHLLVVGLLTALTLLVRRCTKSTTIRFIGFCILAWVLMCPYLAPLIFTAETQEDEVHFFKTADGVRISLSRYRAANSAVGERKQSFTAPVILCHGAFANRFTYDLGKGRTSLAKYLANEGHDVWSLELRGHGRSQKPPFLSTVFKQGLQEGGSWSVIKYIEQDLPAALEYVKSHTRAKKVHWVGHSMGGIILYSWLAFHMENSQDFASIITMGSALDHPRQGKKAHEEQRAKGTAADAASDKKQAGGNMTSAYHFIYVPRSLRSPGLAPFSWLNAILSPFGGTQLDPFDGFQYSRTASKPEDVRAMLANNFESEPWQVVFDIHTVFSKPQGMLHPLTKEPLLPRLNHSLPVPLLAFAGECDLQFKPGAVERTAHHLAATDEARYVRVITPETNGGVCYGHYDLLIGTRADRDIFAPLNLWLREVDNGQHWYPQEQSQSCTSAPEQAQEPQPDDQWADSEQDEASMG